MESQTVFTIKHHTFEGPIEILLELIEKRKLFVNDVSLATVTDDFVSHIRIKGMHPDTVASFLSVAATLILIKARSLLPNLELTVEESDSITDLERRVALYQIITHISNELIRGYGKAVSFEGVSRMPLGVFAPDPKITVDMLAGLINDTAARAPKPEAPKPEARVHKTISITEVLSTLTERIEYALSKMTFNDLCVRSPDGDEKSQKVYTIVSFLGMLELVRCGLLAAEQNELFAQIDLEKQLTNPTAESVQTDFL